MKKYKYILLIVLMLIPIKIWAISITDTTIKGDSEVYSGKKYSYDIEIKIDGLDKNSSDSMGIGSVLYELVFDDKLMAVTEISSKGRWDSGLYIENGKYYVLSTIGKYSDEVGKCADGILYCDNYSATITFYMKEVSKNQKTQIKIGDTQLGALSLIESMEDIENLSEDSIQVITKKQNIVKSITIKKNSNLSKDNFTALAIEKTKPKVSSSKVVSNTKTLTPVSGKSKNNFLEKLEVVGYELEFKKYYNDYRLTVKEDVNELKINYTLADKKAKVNIIGADDLKANNNEVLIEVTSEDGENNTYRISVKHEEKEDVTKTKKGFLDFDFKIDEKYLKIGGIILGGIIFLILLVCLILRIKDHKMEKQLDKL